VKNPPVKAGMFLIAAPGLDDPNFARTVVLMCEHRPQGSLGLVVNRPTTLTASMLLPDVGTAEQVYSGGPVERGKALVLHRHAPTMEGVLELPDGMMLGGEPDSLKELCAVPSGQIGPDGQRVYWRIYLGYAGWGEGQLDSELRSGGWIVCPASPQHVFETPSEEVWKRVLSDLGEEYRFLASLPLDPSLN
jgi:putative transcriptional regulator